MKYFRWHEKRMDGWGGGGGEAEKNVFYSLLYMCDRIKLQIMPDWVRGRERKRAKQSESGAEREWERMPKRAWGVCGGELVMGSWWAHQQQQQRQQQSIIIDDFRLQQQRRRRRLKLCKGASLSLFLYLSHSHLLSATCYTFAEDILILALHSNPTTTYTNSITFLGTMKFM